MLIRRAILGMIFMGALTLGTLQYASYLSHERKKEADRHTQEAEAARKSSGQGDHNVPADAAEILTAN